MVIANDRKQWSTGIKKFRIGCEVFQITQIKKAAGGQLLKKNNLFYLL
jgi:hypothetical protein